MRLRFLYVGSSDVPRDRDRYVAALGASVVWDLHGFGANVAALRMGEGPLVLLASHRPAPSTMPVYEVPDLGAAKRALEAAGWEPDAEVEIPNGPCLVLHDASGNALALFEDVRPGALGGERDAA
ncbi:MAG TPA: hypothetical protein VI997_01850 [Candidatus Thermoplasmatota archaeon]|nr:hypothetical protein [Candidatus Thermoplasmatota archaeon]